MIPSNSAGQIATHAAIEKKTHYVRVPSPPYRVGAWRESKFSKSDSGAGTFPVRSGFQTLSKPMLVCLLIS